ncbi:MAG: hypothetical protein WAL47_06100, partial [Pyrinomonadaceae bacterium]
MLRSNLYISLCLTLAILFLIATVSPTPVTPARLSRVTNTGEEVLNLNPSLSGNGRFIAFESSIDLAGAGGNGFHALVADLISEPPTYEQMGSSRAVAPAISQDGSHIAFASTSDPLGTNADG